MTSGSEMPRDNDVNLTSRLLHLLAVHLWGHAILTLINTDALHTLGSSLCSAFQLQAYLSSAQCAATMKISCFLLLMVFCLYFSQIHPGKYQDLLNPWSGLGTWGLRTGGKCVWVWETIGRRASLGLEPTVIRVFDLCARYEWRARNRDCPRSFTLPLSWSSRAYYL